MSRGSRVLAVIAAGGVLGAFARYGLASLIPRAPDGFPWATFLTNCSGALLIGVLMVLVVEVWPPNPYVRPFLGVGVLGGFTTFSTFMVETRELLVSARPWLALVYLAASLLTGLVAVMLGAALARGYARRRRPGRPPLNRVTSGRGPSPEALQGAADEANTERTR